jgi:hypothetical protein
MTLLSIARIVLFAAVTTAAWTTLGSSADARGLNLDFLGNKDYMNCLQWSGISSGIDWKTGRSRTGAEREAASDRGRRYCNRKHYPGRPNGDY